MTNGSIKALASKRTWLAPALVLTGLGMTAPAHAVSVVITGFTFNPATNLTVPTPAFNNDAGQFTGLMDGNPFVTWCTEIEQHLGFNNVISGYSIVNGAAAWGATKALHLAQLISNLLQFGQPSDPATSAVSQAGIWEIIYETDPVYDFNSGSFTVGSSDALTQNVMNNVNWGALANTIVTVDVFELQHRRRQDLLLWKPRAAPEPGTLALLGLGLTGIGFLRRRKQ